MEVRPDILAILVGAGLVSYLCRVAGYWIMGRVPIGPRVRRGLEALPGATIVAIVAPATLSGGVAAVIALAATLATMLWLKKDLVAIAAGLAVAIGLRATGL